MPEASKVVVRKTVFEDRFRYRGIGEFGGDVKGVELPKRGRWLAFGRDKTTFRDDSEASWYILMFRDQTEAFPIQKTLADGKLVVFPLKLYEFPPWPNSKNVERSELEILEWVLFNIKVLSHERPKSLRKVSESSLFAYYRGSLRSE